MIFVSYVLTDSNGGLPSYGNFSIDQIIESIEDVRSIEQEIVAKSEGIYRSLYKGECPSINATLLNWKTF
jgi:hypothetical protein